MKSARRRLWCPQLKILLSVFICLLAPLSGDGYQEPPADDQDQEKVQAPSDGVTIQLPTLGVSVDAAGVLQAKVFPDMGGNLMAARKRAIHQKLPPEIRKPSPMRKISLSRLEAAIEERLNAGKTPTDEMMNLAGLLRCEYAFVDPDANDIIFAGPAEAWIKNPSGRVVGIESGEPTILLNDLLTILRTFAPGKHVNTWVGCSIDPSAQGLENLKEYQSKIPSRIPQSAQAEAAFQIRQGIKSSLGLANVQVYGIPRQTHVAHVMIEADYRMKMIAVGLEPPPVRMTTFIGALKGAPRHMQRWWLSPNFQCLRQTDDQLAAQLEGRGVMLRTENIDFGNQVRVVRKKTKPSRAARRYAESFTSKYPEISDVRPVFGQLRNMIDMMVLFAWLLKTEAYQQSGWSPNAFLKNDLLPVNTLPDVRHAQCVANAVWKKNVLILPAGGGVSIRASNALLPENLIKDGKDRLKQKVKEIRAPKNDNWWWD